MQFHGPLGPGKMKLLRIDAENPEKGLVLQLDAGGIRMFQAAQTTIAKE